MVIYLLCETARTHVEVQNVIDGVALGGKMRANFVVEIFGGKSYQGSWLPLSNSPVFSLFGSDSSKGGRRSRHRDGPFTETSSQSPVLVRQEMPSIYRQIRTRETGAP